MTDQPLFEVRNLSRTYQTRGRPVRALSDVSFTVQQGDRLGIVGESGSGKSTLIRLMAALDHPTSGTVVFEGEPISGRPERRLGGFRRRVQIVFQDPRSSLNPRMRVRDIITEPLRSGLLRRQFADMDLDARVAELMEAVDLPVADAHRFPHEFSGGQRQRIAIARALAPNPDVLIADEAVSALDVSVRAQVLNLLAGLVAELGLTLIFVSHDLSVVRHVCREMIVLQGGRIVESGHTESLLTEPHEEYTRTLLASVPRFRIR